MDQELFKSCKLVVSEKVPDQNEKLREYITDKLDFKIAKHNPLTIEKENVTYQDWQKLTEVLKAKYGPEEIDSEHSNQTSTSAAENMRSSTLGSKHVSQAHSSGNSYKQNEDPSTGQDVSDAFCKNKITSEQPVSVDDLASTFCGLSISPGESTSKDDADLHSKYTSREDIISTEHEVSTVAIATLFGSENIKSDLTRASKDEIIIERQHHIETGTSLSEKPIITQKQDIMTTNTDNKEAGSAESEETRRSKAGVACMLRSPEERKSANSSELNSSNHDEIHAEDSSGTTAFSSRAEDSGMQLRTQKAVKDGSLSPTVSNQIDIGIGKKFSETLEEMQMNDSYKHVTDDVANSCKMKVDVMSTEKNENVESTLEASDVSSKQNISSSNDVNKEYNHNSIEENRESVRNEENTNSQNETGHHRQNISERDDEKVSCGCRVQHDVEDELRKMSDEEMAKKPVKEAKELQKNMKHFSDESSHEEIVSERVHIEQTTESSRRERDPKTTPQKKENQLKKLGADMQFVKGQEKNFSKATQEGQKSVKCETQNKEKESNKDKTGQSAKNKSKQRLESKKDLIDASLTPDMIKLSDDPEETQETKKVCVSEYLINWTEEWNFECAKQYMNAESYKSFFKNAEIKDAQVTFRLDMSDPDMKSFLKLVKQLKFAKIGFNIRNKEQMKRLARELTPEIGARIEVADTFFMIVGLKEEVSEAKKMITKKLQSQAEAEFRSSENMNIQEENNIGRSRQTLNDGPNKASRYEYEHMHVKNSGCHDEHLKTANLSTSELSKNHFSSSQRSHEQGSYQRGHMFQTEKSKLIVQIQNADITKFKADCIVNAANKRLQHRGGVAKAIAEAAGWELTKDCEDYIKTGKTVDVTDIFVSKGGRLPAKFVLHAVGPMWDAYDDKKWCFDDLRCTVLRCLVEAARRGMSSIALPSISAAIFKVPKEHCARCYMEAVKHFDIFNAREGSPLQEIHFIDVDDTMVNYIIECFLDNWEKPSDWEMLHKDLSFAENHIRSTFKKMSSDYSKPKSSILPAPSGANETKSSTGAVRKSDRNKSYHFGRVILHLKSGHAFDCSAGITITVGKLFDKLSGLPDFQIKQNLKRDDSMPHRKNGYEFFNVSKPNGKQSRLLLTTYPEPDKAETIEESFHNLEMGIQTCDPHQVQRKILQGLIITSSLLYAEPKNSQKQKGGKKRCDRKMIGTFANFLHKFVEKVSKNYTLTVTVVGSEDDLPVIEKVMDSRNVPSAPGAYPNSTARSEGNKSGPRSQAQGERSTQSQYDQTQGERSGSGRYQYGQNQGERVKHGQFDQTQRGNHYQNPPDRPQSGPGAVSSAASSDDMPGLYHNSGSQRNSANTSMNTQNLEHSSMGTSVDSQMKCKICLDEDKHCYSTSCCKNMICLKCETRLSSCPFCRKIWKILKGNQPDGTMSAKLISDSADGYENFGTWKIDYFFPFGKQKDHHPNPGKPYRSVMRTAYLPDSDDGFQLLMLLRLAFVRRLTFTIGHSHTKNVDDVITWNDIHHKTSLHGGIFGYPDPAYIMRAMTELADRGVTFDTVTEEEKHDLNKFHYYCKNLKHFF